MPKLYSQYRFFKIKLYIFHIIAFVKRLHNKTFPFFCISISITVFDCENLKMVLRYYCIFELNVR